MNNRKKISVVIPLYNHELYIRDAIESVLNQTMEVFEVIVIDDGSIDKSGEIVQKMAIGNEKIKYIYQENRGAHNTINRGITMAEGDFIAILNSDDLFKENKVERCLEIIHKNPSTNVVFGGVDFIDGKGGILKDGVPVEWQQRAIKFLEKTNLFSLSILNENFISTTSNIFLKKEALKRDDVFYPLRYCHDLEFIVSCIQKGDCYFDAEMLHISYRYHESNTLKENIRDIKIEVAAVVAVSLLDYKTGILKDDTSNISYFAEFLDNKDISNVIIYLMMLYGKIVKKDEFYDFIYRKENKEMLYPLMK